jgi:prepilin-type N-terminal cleavage/methylation domain-containing protein
MKKVENIKGFTIIEVLVAVIILTLSLLLLLNMAMVALEGNDWSNTATISTQLLQEKLEDLRTTSLLTNGQDTVNNIQRTWTVTNSASHLRRVDITASWYNRQGNLIQNTMTAYIRTDSV